MLEWSRLCYPNFQLSIRTANDMNFALFLFPISFGNHLHAGEQANFVLFVVSTFKVGASIACYERRWPAGEEVGDAYY